MDVVEVFTHLLNLNNDIERICFINSLDFNFIYFSILRYLYENVTFVENEESTIFSIYKDINTFEEQNEKKILNFLKKQKDGNIKSLIKELESKNKLEIYYITKNIINIKKNWYDIFNKIKERKHQFEKDIFEIYVLCYTFPEYHVNENLQYFVSDFYIFDLKKFSK